jgi:hypothetical protein
MANLFRRSNGYYYIVTLVNGLRVWQSTGCKTKRKAAEFLRKKLLPEKHSEAPPPPPASTDLPP